MLKELIKRYGYDKVNSLTKYPSIKTLHEMSAKGILTEKRNHLAAFNKEDELFAFEKIDGLNVRILIYHDEYIIGSREELLYHNLDTLYNKEQSIVERIKSLSIPIPMREDFTVVYGELYGEGIGRNGHQYGAGTEFRIFDILNFPYFTRRLSWSVERIAFIREIENDPQRNPFSCSSMRLEHDNDIMFERAPKLAIPSEILYGLTTSSSHERILHFLKNKIPQRSAVCLSENAQGKTEGIIIRDANRSSIVKLRLEDYQRTCNQYLLKRSKNEQNP